MKKNNNKKLEIIKYIFFGFLTTLISLTTYYLLTSTIFNAKNPIELQITNIISWIISVNFAYITNKIFVFKSSNKKLTKEILSFYTSRIFSLLLDMLIMYIFVTLIHLNDLLAKLIVQIIIIITNYLLSKFIIFKNNS